MRINGGIYTCRNIEELDTIISQEDIKMTKEYAVGQIAAPNSRIALKQARKQYNKILGRNTWQTVAKVRLLAKGDYIPELGRRGYRLYSVIVHINQLKQNPEIFTIKEDRMGNILITSDVVGGSVFLQFESDKEIIYDLLRKGERKDLDNGWAVEIRGDEPRASIIGEVWEAQNGSR